MKLEIFRDNKKVNEINNQLEIILSYCEALQNKYINKGDVRLKYSYSYEGGECKGTLKETFSNGVVYVYSNIPCQAYLLDRFKVVEILKNEEVQQ